MVKAKDYKGGNLTGVWEFTRKIDGVRALKDNGVVTSKSGKPLHNLNDLDFTDAEIYLGSWNDSVSAVRTVGHKIVRQEDVYNLHPLDIRLHLFTCNNPTEDLILSVMRRQVGNGDEGLVLRQGDKWLKVKPKVTYDVPITGVQLGTGKYRGLLGAFITPLGKVGTGFSDADRYELLRLPLGTVIEVEGMALTSNGKIRHPRFIRVRWDK